VVRKRILDCSSTLKSEEISETWVSTTKTTRECICIGALPFLMIFRCIIILLETFPASHLFVQVLE
jgi:hypothetical protein